MIKREEGPRLIKCDDMPALQVMGFGQRRLWGCLVERYEDGWGWRGLGEGKLLGSTGTRAV